MTSPGMEALLEEFRNDLRSFLARHGVRLLRFETADDLVQGCQLRILERGREFDYRSREQFLKWMYTVARSYLADRQAYWRALKRRSSKLLRLTWGGTPADADGDAVREPAATATGPSTFADRREQLSLAIRVLAAMVPRDRDLVRWSSEDVLIEEQAKRLDLSYEAAQRARLRALERFRKAYRIAAGLGPI